MAKQHKKQRGATDMSEVVAWLNAHRAPQMGVTVGTPQIQTSGAPAPAPMPAAPVTMDGAGAPPLEARLLALLGQSTGSTPATQAFNSQFPQHETAQQYLARSMSADQGLQYSPQELLPTVGWLPMAAALPRLMRGELIRPAAPPAPVHPDVLRALSSKPAKKKPAYAEKE